jgi:hypothetical protein
MTARSNARERMADRRRMMPEYGFLRGRSIYFLVSFVTFLAIVKKIGGMAGGSHILGAT